MDIEILIEKNHRQWLKEVEEEIKRRSDYLHATYTLLICNQIITGQQKNNIWLRDSWGQVW